MKHLGFYILRIDIDDNGIVGTAELEDTDVYQDDTAILHNGDPLYLNLYYQYNPNGYEELGGVKWRLIEESTINKLQEFWEERNVIWMEDEDSAALTTLVKLRTPQGIQLEKDEITKYDIKLKATIITTRPGIIENIVSNISSNPDIIAISWDHKKYISSDNEDIEEELEEDS